MPFIKRIKNKYFLIVIISVAISLIAEFFTNFDVSVLKDTTEPGKYKKINVSEFSPVNARFEEDIIYSENDDPMLVCNGVDIYAESILISYDNLSYSVTPLQIYYTGESEDYSEEYCVSDSLKDNKKSCYIEVDGYIKDLRIDIGDTEKSHYRIKNVIINPRSVDYIVSVIRNMSLTRGLLFFLLALTVLLVIADPASFKTNLHKYRFFIGLGVILLFTVLKINGSSIGYLAQLMTGSDTNLLLGQNRAIRTDEYVVFTEMAISQVKSGFKWFSDIWGYSPSDMFIIYGQPVLNPVTIFRPFSVFYIFLGTEMGLAFYWISRIIVGLLVSYEFGRVITKDDRDYSFIYSLLVIFAPIVQWWFSTNELVEMLIAGQLALIIVYKYIHSKKIVAKILLALSFVWCAGVYVLTLYPAWMIPLAYVFLAAGVGILIENRKSIKVKAVDIGVFVGALIVFIGAFYYIYTKSGDTIRTILNTAYPGKRSYDGGPIINVFELFRGWTSYIWSFTECNNPCEEVCFISFFPLGIVLSCIAVFKNKIKDSLLISLNISNVILVLYSIVPLPEFIGKISLLNKSHSMRIIVAIGFLNLMILFRALYCLKAVSLSKYRILFVTIAVISTIISISAFDQKQGTAISLLILIIAVVLGFLLSGVYNLSTKHIFVVYCLALAIIGGVMVNPVSKGVSAVFKEPQIEAIEDINNNKPGIWMTVGTNSFANIPAMLGADTASALDTYPDEELWNGLSLQDENYSWNRYAHKVIKVGDETRLELKQDDLVELTVTVDDLKKLGINYLFSITDLSAFEGLSRIFDYTNFYIYEVCY